MTSGCCVRDQRATVAGNDVFRDLRGETHPGATGNISTVRAGQRLGIREVDDGTWPIRFMRHDPGYFDLEQ